MKMLVEMGFQQADCIQAMQEADNDMELALDGLQNLSLSTRGSSRDENSRPARGKGGKRGRRGRNNFEEEEKTRPQGSLMDFIGGDLPETSSTNQEARIQAEIRQINSERDDRSGSRNDRFSPLLPLCGVWRTGPPNCGFFISTESLVDC